MTDIIKTFITGLTSVFSTIIFCSMIVICCQPKLVSDIYEQEQCEKLKEINN